MFQLKDRVDIQSPKTNLIAYIPTFDDVASQSIDLQEEK